MQPALISKLREAGIWDERILTAMASLDRARFLPEELRGRAGADEPISIGHGQTISQPFVVAFMSQALELQPGARVLEIGTGSGYQAAVLARMGMDVCSVEILPQLAEQASARLSRLGLDVRIRVGDGAEGWPDAAPFDGGLATAAAARFPKELLRQLKPGGRFVAPVGSQEDVQELLRWRRLEAGEAWQVERLLAVRFVPMTGWAARQD